MRRIALVVLGFYASAALFAATGADSAVRDVLAKRLLLFEPLPGGREYKSWSPHRQIRLTAEGWDVMVGSDADGPKHLGMRVVGANSTAAAEATGPVSLRSTYIRGSAANWRRTDFAFRRVTWRRVLNGVDIAYYGNEGNQLEFDLILNPGVNPAALRLHFTGQDSVRTNKDGDLVLNAGQTRLVQRFPTIYQETASTLRYVPGKYQIRPDGDVDFALGHYDRSRPLIIDPIVEFAAYPGGRGDDSATSIARGRDGFLYVAGTTMSGDLPIAGDAEQNTRPGDSDVFVMKIDPKASADSAIVYSTFIGGSGRDDLRSMTMGPDGMLYLTGVTSSTNFPVSGNAAQSASKGASDAFAIKFDPSQSGTAGLVYSTYLGGANADAALAGAVGADGSFVIVGYSASPDFPLAGNPYQSNLAGGWDMFVSQFNPDGALVYSTFLGGESTDIAQAVAVGADGAIFVGGWTASPFIQLAGPIFQDANMGRGDGLLFKLVPALGTSGLVYSSYLGGSAHDEIRAIAVDKGGRIVVTGTTVSPDFPTTPGAMQAQPKGYVEDRTPTDGFITVLDATKGGSASLLYSTLFGGTDGDVPLAMKLDTAGHAIVTGYTLSHDYPTTSGAYQADYQGLTDAFLTSFDLTPQATSPIVYSTYIGGSGVDIAFGLDIDDTGRVFVAGSTSSRKLAPDAPVTRDTDPGDRNAFLITFRP